MTALIITVAQQKGGAGKTTMVAQLAVAMKTPKRSVALLDIDPQGSLSRWYQERQAVMGEDAGGIHLSTVAGWRVNTEVDRLRERFDLVIIDSPPHAETEAKIAIRAADLVVVPVQPSPMDLWATEPTLAVAKSEKVPAVIVLNRVPPRGRLVEHVRDLLAGKEMPVTDAELGNRVAYASSMIEGQGVVELSKRSTASQEVSKLSKELLSLLKKK